MSARGLGAESGLVCMTLDRARDPDGKRLRDTLESIAQVERFQSLRVFFVHATVVLALPLWVEVAWPDWGTVTVRVLTVLAFAGGILLGAVAWALELEWRRHRDRLLEAGSPPETRREVLR